jgi:hypothetical protein
MANQFIHRILTRQFLGSSALSDLLSAVVDATPTNNPGSKIFVQDIAGNMTSFVYAYTVGLTAIAVGSPMFWTSVARTTVSDTLASAVTYAATADSAIQSAAGVAINATPTTAAPYAWLICGGYMAGVPVPSSASVGDLLVLSNAATTVPTADAWVRVAKGTSPSTPQAISTLYCVVTAASGTGSANVLVMGTCGLP